jgi:hypothetical protein
MAIKNYQWKTDNSIISGGYQGERVGVIPNDSSWHTTDALSGSVSAEYYFHDSDTFDNNNSSRVVVKITEQWDASISIRNVLTVTLRTTIDSIRRDNIAGYPGSAGRNMFLRRYEGGPVLWSTSNDSVSTAHIILGSPLVLGTYTFNIAAGQNLQHGSIYFRSNTVGHDGDTPPSSYVDIMQMGLTFRNILPADYRPGATLDSNGVWQAHDRDDGKAHILTPQNTWREMRSSGGLVVCGNPPSIYLNNKWYNQREFGTE